MDETSNAITPVGANLFAHASVDRLLVCYADAEPHCANEFALTVASIQILGQRWRDDDPRTHSVSRTAHGSLLEAD
jgi:hypothetical protein